MLRKKLKDSVKHFSDEEFLIICEMITDDLMFNRALFYKVPKLKLCKRY